MFLYSHYCHKHVMRIPKEQCYVRICIGSPIFQATAEARLMAWIDGLRRNSCRRLRLLTGTPVAQ